MMSGHTLRSVIIISILLSSVSKTERCNVTVFWNWIFSSQHTAVVVWHNDSTLVSISEVNIHWTRLVLGWLTVSGFNSRCGTFISVCNQPLRSTQPGHPLVGRRNEYQPKDSDALQLGSKRRYGSHLGGR